MDVKLDVIAFNSFAPIRPPNAVVVFPARVDILILLRGTSSREEGVPCGGRRMPYEIREEEFVIV